ncbi:hypothetical protein OAN51_01250 [Acidimicrobiia bacterium]|nr:hypothetical protein [Acidimicrobiia bacterium]
MFKSKSKFEYLYCFDDNFNKQAFTSMISLLDNVKEPVAINAIHPDPDIHNKVPELINKHKNLRKLNFYLFKNCNYQFPNLDGNHISEATYYRLFIDKYLQNTVKNIVYIDADMVCINDPTDAINITISDLIRSDQLVSVKTEFKYKDPETDIFERLNLSENYFNAGLMIINYEKWINDQVGGELLEIMNKNYSKIVFWDQDVLNLYINGAYLELDEKLNYYSQYVLNNLEDKKYLIHYVGSKKPWLTSGAFEIASEFYHLNFRKLYSNDYHIEHKWKTASIKEIFLAIIRFKILRLNSPFFYIKDFIKSLRK